jgi:hypothetical protein
MNKLKYWGIKLGLVSMPKGYKKDAVDRDKDGKVQEGTPFERKAPTKKIAKKTVAKKTGKSKK